MAKKDLNNIIEKNISHDRSVILDKIKYVSKSMDTDDSKVMTHGTFLIKLFERLASTNDQYIKLRQLELRKELNGPQETFTKQDADSIYNLVQEKNKEE